MGMVRSLDGVVCRWGRLTMDIRERMQQLIGDYAGTENLRVVDVEWLKEIEWCIEVDCGSHMDHLCPVCIERECDGHAIDCEFAALIGSGGDDGDQR